MTKSFQTSILSLILLYLVSIGAGYLLSIYVFNLIFVLAYANYIFGIILVTAFMKNTYTAVKEMTNGR